MIVFLVIADRCPVIKFDTEDAAKRFCASRPDFSYREFEVPSVTASREEVENYLKDLFALKQTLRGASSNTNIEGLDQLVRQRYEMHKARLENVHATIQKEQNVVIPGACEERACPGRAASSLLDLS